MDFHEYQVASRLTRVYPEESRIIYPVLKLNGEAGEIAEKVGKWLRGDLIESGISDYEFKLAVGKEIGDVLWYLAALSDDLGLDLSKIAEQNIAKLIDRHARGVLKGSGDDR